MFKGSVDTFSVLLDVVLFKEANYIVGSQTSNIFRLATALNHFHHKGDKKRAHEIDRFEWQPGADITLDKVCEECVDSGKPYLKDDDKGDAEGDGEGDGKGDADR